MNPPAIVRFFRRSFLGRILLTFSLISLIALFLLAEIVLQSIGRILTERDLQQNAMVLRRVEDYFSRQYRVAITVYQRMYLETQTPAQRPIRFLEETAQADLRSRLDARTAFESYLASTVPLDAHLEAMVVAKGADLFLWEQRRVLLREISSADLRFRLPSPAGPGFTVLPAHMASYLMNPRRVYDLAAPVMSFDLTRKVGDLVIEFDTQAVGQAFGERMDFLGGYVIVLTGSGEVVFDSSGRYYDAPYPYANRLAPSRKEARLERDSVVSTVTLDEPRVVLAAIVPKSEIAVAARTVRRTAYLVSLACLTATVLVAALGTSRVSRRVRALTDAMRRLREGDVSARVAVVAGGDEIAEISASFNRMAAELSDYIDRVLVSEIREKSVQLEALQAKVNPHFLYNTLEVIRMRALKGGDEETGEMIRMLAELFRSTIRSDTVIDVGEELSNCAVYLELFKLRFEDRLRVEIEAPQGVRECGVLKHLLQPAVENYIVHGFDARCEDNLVRIQGERTGGGLVLRVSDNGKGIEHERLRSIRESLEKSSGPTGAGIGLQSIRDRVRLVHGEGYGLAVESAPGQGTTVTVMIPALTVEELKRRVQSPDR